MFIKIRIVYYSLFLKRIPSEYHEILVKYNEYYNDLSQSLQKAFRERIYIANRFIRFSPIQYQSVTLEMQVLITSALVQITFGLDQFVLKRFRRIFVVPYTYSFAQYPALLGHVDFHNDVIAMSWPSVKEGFTIPDDAMNVALHELTHALQGEDEERLLFGTIFGEKNILYWEIEARKELESMKEKKHKFLRDYAGQNLMEMFAVSIESFFEQSEIFKEEVPRLYAVLSSLLNQDPTNKSNPILPS